MSTITQGSAPPIAVIHNEAMLLDERRWSPWLSLYAVDCEYWVPMWLNEDTLNEDPRTSLSHIYYGSRAGLDDRVARITSHKSPASNPLPRTTHIIGASVVLAQDADLAVIRSAWACHVVLPRHKDTHVFFGSYIHELRQHQEGWLISKKHIKLMNDYIPTMLDVYCL